MFSQYCELRPTSGRDRIGPVVWGTPTNFNGLSRLGSVTARYSSSGRQPNFAALNRGRHLYSAGRPSRWASAHILVLSFWVTILSDRCLMQVGLDPSHIVLDGDPAPPPQKGHNPQIFGRCVLWHLWPNGRPSQLLLSTCHNC